MATAQSYATNLLRDELNPGTQNVGHALPVIAQAFIYTRLVPVGDDAGDDGRGGRRGIVLRRRHCLS